MARFRAAALLASALLLTGGAPAFAQLLSTAPRIFVSGQSYHVALCGPCGHRRCFAHVVTDRTGRPLHNRFVPNRLESTARSNLVPAGFGPRALILAYSPRALPGIQEGWVFEHHHRNRRRLRIHQRRARPGGLPKHLQTAPLHDGQRLLHQVQPERREGQLPGAERRLGGGDGARPRHGQRHVPELQDHTGPVRRRLVRRAGRRG